MREAPSTNSSGRIAFMMVLCVGFGGALMLRAAYLQIFPNQRLANLAKKQFYSKMLVKPRRGNILDRNSEALAISVETQSLAVNPSKVVNKKLMAIKLAHATGVPQATILKRLQSKKEFAWIKRHLTADEEAKLKKFRLVDEDGDWLAGLWVIKESQRAYPHQNLANTILGTVNTDAEGIEGVELLQNATLSGKIISVDAVKDALGRPTFIDAEAAKKGGVANDGKDIQLTLDASLQYSSEQLLKESVHKTGSLSGIALVMDAMNGEILALAHYPNDTNRRNRAVTDGYEPGSTFKPILLAAALQKGSHLTDAVWGGKGKFEVQGHTISEAEAHEQHEWLTLKKMIQVSSNVGAARLALQVGSAPYLQLLNQLGFGAKTQVNFPGEFAGKIFKPGTKLQPLALATLGFGQGLLATPIQMARAYAAFINGGWLVQPSLVMSDSAGKVEPPKRVFTPQVCQQVLEALASVTQEGGTGTKANLPGYRIAGKTGTAQVVDPKSGKYSRTHYLASFIGFPLDLPKKVVIFTALDRPQGVYYASENAAPLFAQIANALVHRYSLPTLTKNQIVSDQIRAPSAQAISASKLPEKLSAKARNLLGASSVSSEKIKDGLQEAPSLELAEQQNPDKKSFRVPNFKGLNPREVLQTLRGYDLKIEISGIGSVVQQFPESGKSIAEGESIRIILADRP